MHRYISEIVVFLVLRARLAPDVFTTRSSYDPSPTVKGGKFNQRRHSVPGESLALVVLVLA